MRAVAKLNEDTWDKNNMNKILALNSVRSLCGFALKAISASVLSLALMLGQPVFGEASVRGSLNSDGAGHHFAHYDVQVDPLLEAMTLSEKIGQMTQADLSSLKGHSEIRNLALGSVLSGGNSDPPSGNTLNSPLKNPLPAAG
jgi:hypothetical protein